MLFLYKNTISLFLYLYIGIENLNWCQNPQYILRLAPHTTTNSTNEGKENDLTKPIYAKIVLKRTSYKATTKARRDHQKEKAQLIGLTIVKPDIRDDASSSSSSSSNAIKKANERTNFLGEPLGSPTTRKSNVPKKEVQYIYRLTLKSLYIKLDFVILYT